MVKVSFIIPTYNRARVLKRSVDSALNQTYRDFEILIVDDGSTDETFDVVKPFLQFPRVRYVRHDMNKGSQAARNTGIKNARGDYIAFLDSDDTWIPNKTELQLEAIKKRGADYVVLSGIWKIENGVKKRFFDKQYEGCVYTELLASDGPGFGCLLVPRSWLAQIGFLDERIAAFADWDTCISLSKLFRFTTVDEPCVNYYQDDPHSIQKNRRELALSYQYVLKKHQDDMRRFLGRSGLARHYLTMALLFDDAGDFGSCRHYILKAFETNGKNPSTFLLAMLTLLGERIFHLRKPISRVKQSVKEQLGRIR
ncbi:MAG TPA: glycosyltransferase family 2 protein [Candidatus Acidoferrales bacterium]|nr:glycosyltransferase family 2 protein [Candidatus Acidoferrales bacterium]